MPEIVLAGRTVRYEKRLSARARRVSLRAAWPRGIELVVPARGAPASPERALVENAGWVLRQLERLDRLASEAPRIEWRDGGSIPLLGNRCPIAVVEGPFRSAAANYEGGLIRVRMPFGAGTEAIRRAVLALLARIAKEIFASRVRQHASRIGVQAGRIRVRVQKARWGSCSATRELAFNLRLLLAPPEVLDCVVAHEVAHFVHMDHGRAFKALLARLCPEHRAHERWLDERGDALIF